MTIPKKSAANFVLLIFSVRIVKFDFFLVSIKYTHPIWKLHFILVIFGHSFFEKNVHSILNGRIISTNH